MKFFFGALALLAVGLSRGEDEYVKVGTDANWGELVEKEDLVLVEFYAPWCGHCKQLAPKFEEAAKILADDGIVLVKVDATEEKKYSGLAGVSGYPTLKIYRQGSMSDFEGARETDEIVEQMRKQKGPSSFEVTEHKDLKEKFSKKSLEKVAVVGYFGTKGNEYKEFMGAAHNFRGKFDFYHVTDSAILEKVGYYGSKSAVFIYRPWGTAKTFKKSFTGSFNRKSIIDFVTDNAFPLVGLIDASSMADFTKGKPVLRAFTAADDKKLQEKLIKELEPVQKKFGKKLLFAINDEGHDEYEGDLKEGIIAIEALGKKYLYDKEQGSVSEWVGKWAKKKAPAMVKSEKPVPRAEPGEVQVVVGKTFDEIVLDNTKDVLIEFYAPWCGHCKQLEPKYAELAEKLKGEKNVVIAKIDATANDVHHKKYSASGFPTIYFAPANNKESPLTYDSGRDVDSFVEYIKKHASVELTAPDEL
eukprot:TRINITY_DN994_c1_g5_i1.p1 TRINITY_DN994_c1_g5~~TRINITY_DN994_c1_g5_i1.p1  ORF type:complete len:494 (+),score=165.05 TRINITY_DN994_c1_g5_i1:67-1482(+)